jgi:hypothetical protein
MYAALAILPSTNSSLTTVAFATIAGGAGFADSYYSPFMLGWHEKRADLQASYSGGVVFQFSADGCE